MIRNITVATLLFISSVFITSCDQGNDVQSELLQQTEDKTSLANKPVADISLLDTIKKRGKLIVLTTNLPTTYYFDRDNQATGPEYDITQSFAKSLQVDVEYKIYDSTKELIDALRNKEGDIAAAGLTVNEKRKTEFDFGPVYQKTNEYLVCHRDKKRIKNEAGLKGLEIVLAADSSYTESIKAYPDVQWTTDQHLNTVDLITQVANKKISCTVSDSTLYDIERRYHTEIQNKYTLAKESELAWMFNKHNDELGQTISNWFVQYKEEHELARMLEKYYGFIEIFDYVDTHKFLKRVKTRLPKYKDFFVDAAEKNDIEPSLLAAQSYQESHWNRKAKSPTGVRGIMMLTQPVAKSLGVTNRLNAKQNIYAGAKFHAKMKKMVEQVDEPTRSWLALAAYNIGRGHFRDAQSLARKLNKNPDYWHDMKEVLPLLSQKKYYKNLRYGYARGNEPVRYVTRIRNYDELLHRHFISKSK
jgi:peptidoglycan lytic transglycosylase F